MPNEISYQFQTNLTNGSLKDTHASQGLVTDQTTAKLIRNVQTIGFVAHGALKLGDLVTPGIAVFQNLDDTNFLEIGLDVAAVFVPFAKIKPGEQFFIRLSTSAPFALADTADVELFYIILDD